MKPARLFLLLSLFLLPLAAGGQVYQTLVYSYDSTGHRTQRDSIDYLPMSSKGSVKQLDTALQKITPFHLLPEINLEMASDSLRDISVADSSRGRLIFTDAEKAAAYVKWIRESEDIRTTFLRSIRAVQDTTNYALGDIPLQDGMTPSGARTYSIPIPTAAGFKFVPSVAIGYNSQAAEGWAGYGWDIQGISSITLINRNKYYHGEARGANVHDLDPVFALDGIPLVTNTQSETSTSYPLVTARGNILVCPIDDGPAGWIWGFDALYPNGMRVRYGAPSDESRLSLSYPVTEMTDMEGRKITFSYSDTAHDGNYRLDAIRYGYDSVNQFNAEISFTYAYISNAVVRHYAGMNRTHRYKLVEVLSKNGSQILARYSLSYNQSDNVPLLSQVDCTNDSTSLRPLRFEYGDMEPFPPDARLELGDSLLILSAFPSSSGRYVYRRGKFAANHFNDGLLIYPLLSEYDVIDRRKPLFGDWEYLFGSCYPSDQEVLFVPVLKDDATVYNSITTGSGFQTVEAVDVDGDGLDEIVKVNFNGISGANTRLLITVYEYNPSEAPTLTDQFEVQIQGTVTSGIYTSPSYRTYRWGDFLGNGKAQLLAVAFNRNVNSYEPGNPCPQTSYAALIDISTHSKLFDTELFTLSRGGGSSLMAIDWDNDSVTELCFADNFGLKVYRYHPTQGFEVDKTYTSLTTSILSSTTRPCYWTDLNGDGYPDILRSPEVGDSTYWDRYSFNGDAVTVSSIVICARSSNDEFMFIDVNRDGLADLVKMNGASIGSFINQNGNGLGPWQLSPHSISSAKGIVPANVVDYTGMSSFINIEGFYAYTYGYTRVAPEQRHLTKVVDSRRRMFFNHYDYLPTKAACVWNDSTFSVNNAEGFVFRTLPVYVMDWEDAYLTDGITDDRFKTTHYSYFNGVAHQFGLGFCGFSKIRSHDTLGGEWYTDEIHDPQKMGVVTAIEKRKNSYNGNPYSSVVNTYDSHTTTYGKLNPRLVQSVAADTLTRVNVTTAYTYDGYDFPLTVNVSRRIGSGTAKTESTSYTYSHSVNTSKYVLGAVTQEEVLKEGDGDTGSSWREVVQTAYDADFRPVLRSAFADTSLVSRTRWCYDAHGNVISEKTAPYNAEVFTGDTLTFDSAGRHLLTRTDALGHTTTYTGYNKFGKPSSATDYRGRTTSFFYDDWGDLVRTVYPDSTVEQSTKAWGGDGLYTVTSTATGKPDQVVHYDALGRDIKSGVKRFNGQWQWANKEYDRKGRIKRVSLPYRGASPAYWNTYHYDYYDRPDTLREASGRLTTWSYSGTSTTTIKEGIASTKTTDANGNLVSASDPGGTITYGLRDDGQPHTITAFYNVQTSIAYDRFGNRCQINDPSAGIQRDTTVWNADGSSTHIHTNAKGSISTHRDRFGRTTLVERPEFDTSYYYDNYGRLSSESSMNGTSVTYTYDSLDRISEVLDRVSRNKWLKRKYHYGAGSVLASVQFISPTDTITTERYNYANGHLTGVTLSNGMVVWSLVSENDLGKPTQITSGTIDRQYGYSAFGLPTYRYMDGSILQEFSYSFDAATGNLLWRQDEINFQSETFTYDSLNRLTGSTSSSGFSGYYSLKGNPAYRDDIGFYYFDDDDHPYQATALEVEHPNLARGRSQRITYTSYDRPSRLSEGGRIAAFTYNADYDRVRMQVTDSVTNATLLTRYYIGGRYELDIAGNTTKERLYLGGDAYSAPMVYVREGGTNGTWTAYNIGRDYLGSITHIATTSGTLVAEYSYDPWGRLRDPATLAVYTVGNEPELFLGRGFTGHEHLPWFGLINMNARLYDPLLGRFLSPDPYVQAPDFTQSLNRYSYALNNPLKYTDESGEFIGTILTALFKLPSLLLEGLIAPAFVALFDTNKAGDMMRDAFVYYGDKVANAFRIDMGVFQTDPNLSPEDRFSTIVSRFSIEILQTIAGNALSQFRNFNWETDVTYYNGATLVNCDFGDERWGVTMGSYINGQNVKADPVNDSVFAHEYGHIEQSRDLGPLYLFVVGVPSMVGCLIDGQIHEHNREWYEVWANQISYSYFDSIGRTDVTSKWRDDLNPREQNLDWYFYLTLAYYASFLFFI